MDIKLTEGGPGFVAFEAAPDARLYNPIGPFTADLRRLSLILPADMLYYPGCGPVRGLSLDLQVAYHKAITCETWGSCGPKAKLSPSTARRPLPEPG